MTYLCQLMPIQIMSRIEFEDEDIINLCLRPYLTVNAK